MKNKYDQVMDQIEVTEAMRDRILNNVKALDLEQTSNKATWWQYYKKYLPIAACFLLLVMIPTIRYHKGEIPDESQIQLGEGIVEFGSKEALSEVVGFDIKGIQTIPFQVETVKYTSFFTEVAEVEYIGGDQTVTLRMAFTDEDVSGDYSEYSSIEYHKIDDYDVIIKGNNGKYSLAIWKQDGFSYTIRMIPGISAMELLEMVESIK